MKKGVRRLLYIAIAVAGLFAILNVGVTTRQGVDYKVHVIRLPLYLKVLDFFDRHYNYAELVKKILRGTKSDRENVMKLLEWTHHNIKKAPEGLPIVDDHVWYIIVRGYGVRDQFSDVFSTLCNYAGIDAYFDALYKDDRKSRIPISYVRLNKNWHAFDPYAGTYFVNADGDFASLEEMKAGNWQARSLPESDRANFDYKAYIANLPVIKTAGLRRANIQSPLRRFISEVNKWIKPR